MTETSEFDPAINRLVEDITKAESRIAEQKRMVNRLCELAERPPLYANIDEPNAPQIGNIRTDRFYGQPLATAIRDYLQMRKASGLGAASVREIYDTLIKGGFKFEAKDDVNAQRGLRQSLTKNSATFHKLPNGAYGLLEWYPGAKPARPDREDDEDEAS
jgi:hypothetical protein